MDVRHFVNGKIVSAPQGGKPSTDSGQSTEASLEVESVVGSKPFAVISVGNCPQCEELAALLAVRGVPSSVFIKWDRQSAEYASLKASLARHAGDIFSFPQVFREGVYQGGFKDVMDKVERGAYDDLFEREFDVVPMTIQRMVENRSMVVFSLPNCPQCDELREDLSTRKVPVQDIFVKFDKQQSEYPALKAQMQKLLGRDQFAFPQTFVRGVYQGNFDEVIAKANQGSFVDFFAEEFGIAPAQPSPMPTAALNFDDDDDF